ncbi:MAG: PAS domain-containing protein [Acidobacteria bacterium]|nr:PAS domain-containing protein [Acidobacteriota bacterium]
MAGNNGSNLMLVGLGASAGGVEALGQFFERMPADTGMAYVVILHLAPDHESRLAEVLQAKTEMPVLQVREPVRVEPNRVYVVSPDRDLYMADGHIRLAERGEVGGRPAPVDLFLRTLADNYRERAIAVVLSGAGTDGSVGVRRVKELGGVVIAQEPSEAEHAAMPRGAVETGAVDFVLPVAAMPEKLVSLLRNADRIQLPEPEETPPADAEAALREVLALLRARTRHDFSGYKRSTLLRRIERRMQVTETEDLTAYLAHVREHQGELPALLSDLLISVTNFFRDRETFVQLESGVMPLLFAGKGADEQVRVWVPGCATGEEAYSMAILLVERAERLPRPPAVQVFASDIDEEALARAREGVYPEAIAADLSPERLRRFFVRDGQHYRVKRELRELVLFTPHNVLRDPPFSKLDLVSCRNLLIYINRQTQERVFEIFHFALRPGGHLFLGSSETAEGMPNLFVPVDKKHRIFRRLDGHVAFRSAPSLPMPGPWEARPAAPAPQTNAPGAGAEPSSFGELHYLTLEALAPPSVMVNADYDIVHSSETAGRFLRFAGGEPSRNLLKVAHPDLHLELRSLLLRAEQSDGATRDVTVQMDGGRRVVRLSVRPVASTRTAPGFRLVVFEELPASAPPQRPEGDGVSSAPGVGAGETPEPVVRQLEDDLQRTREQLRATVEMYETQAEEFRAANEELQATNEELRSASEELETGKEELQAVNEELSTVNAELRENVEEVGRANSDLQNLMHATQIATLFLDRSLRIKRYTSKVQELFNLIPTDMGRPLSHLTHRLDYAGLAGDAGEVLRTLHSVEREAATREGRFFLVRLMPYRTTDDRIEGVVATFVDITERRQAEEAVRESNEKLARELEDTKQLQRISSLLIEEGDSGALYAQILDAAIAIMDADFGSIQMLDAERGELKLLAWRNFHPDAAEFWQTVSVETGSSCGSALQHGERIIVPDVNADDSVITSENLQYQHLSGIAAVQSTPLTTREGRVVGMISTHWREVHTPAERELRLLDILARQAADFFERRRAEEALRESEERLRRLNEELEERVRERTLELGEANASLRAEVGEHAAAESRVKQLLGQLITVQEEERRRSARELHDTLGQQLAALHMAIELIRAESEGRERLRGHVERTRSIFERLNSDVDFLAWELRPAALDQLGLDAALQTFVQEWSRQFGVEADYRGLGDGAPRLAPEVETNLYRILQEALQNVHKHAGATHVSVLLERDDGRVSLIVEDDGRGYDPDAEESAGTKKGMGVTNMRERASLVGGEVEIESTPGAGTTIYVRVPAGGAGEKGGGR